jgi:cysteine synthase A
MLFPDNALSIGRTPLIKLDRITGGAPATVLVKVEGRNPAYSVKDRIGAAMVFDAEKKGLLGAGREIVEPTSGNTGIALAFVAAARGYGITLIMPESMSMERRRVLAAFGANLVLTEAAGGMKAAIAKAEEMVASDPGRYFMPDQFKNPANPEIHFQTTGPEIWQDTGGAVDVFVSGVGTGGTLTGVARYLKNEMRKKVVSVAVEPSGSPVISQTMRGEPLAPGSHKIQGLGAGFIPKTLDLSVVDRVEQVENDEALEWARRLAREEGILSGISSGAAAAAAVRLAQQPEFRGKTIVAILPDSGERYLSTPLFEGFTG